MNLLTLHRTKSPADFVEYWSQFYNYRNEHIYTSVLSKHKFNANDILKIYQWKNNIGGDGKSMTQAKMRYVKRVQTKITIVNTLKSNFDLAHFKMEFGGLSAIWGILLLHVIRPKEYPLYDRHVHRAFRFITAGLNEKIPAYDSKKYQIYYNDYVPFFTAFCSKTNGFTGKEVDNSLMMFGQFLSRYSISTEFNNYCEC